jgi:hypothetical protein
VPTALVEQYRQLQLRLRVAGSGLLPKLLIHGW